MICTFVFGFGVFGIETVSGRAILEINGSPPRVWRGRPGSATGCLSRAILLPGFGLGLGDFGLSKPSLPAYFMTHFGPDFEYFVRSAEDPSGTDPDWDSPEWSFPGRKLMQKKD